MNLIYMDMFMKMELIYRYSDSSSNEVCQKPMLKQLWLLGCTSLDSAVWSRDLKRQTEKTEKTDSHKLFRLI